MKGRGGAASVSPVCNYGDSVGSEHTALDGDAKGWYCHLAVCQIQVDAKLRFIEGAGNGDRAAQRPLKVFNVLGEHRKPTNIPKIRLQVTGQFSDRRQL